MTFAFSVPNEMATSQDRQARVIVADGRTITSSPNVLVDFPQITEKFRFVCHVVADEDKDGPSVYLEAIIVVLICVIIIMTTAIIFILWRKNGSCRLIVYNILLHNMKFAYIKCKLYGRSHYRL